ncbi:MAG: RNA methyltransferase [Pseudomonadota bacterium]
MSDRAPTDAQPVVVLVRPQLGENIGACARAMLNCGLTTMRVVAPRDGWPNADAYPPAAGADAILDDAEVFDDLAAALADRRRVYATTARPRDLSLPVLDPRKAATAFAREADCAILFGAERSGLDNEEVAAADAIIEAPLNPDFMSLNLAQAVLLVAWEWRMAAGVADDRAAPLEAAATAAERAGLYAHLAQALDARGFFKSAEKRPRVLRNLRALMARARPTAQETRTLRGIVTCLTERPLR